jgi:hypothetical protein
LIEKGIDAEKITAAGYGKFFPIATNETRTGRRENQRVEMRIRAITERTQTKTTKGEKQKITIKKGEDKPPITLKTPSNKADETIDLPLVLTPNGDGKNDVFTPQNRGNITNIQLLQIKSGLNILWEKKDFLPPAGWDGRIKGKKHIGKWNYRLIVAFQSGKVATFEGTMVVE